MLLLLEAFRGSVDSLHRDGFFHDVCGLTWVTSGYPGAVHREGHSLVISVNWRAPSDPSERKAHRS